MANLLEVLPCGTSVYETAEGVVGVMDGEVLWEERSPTLALPVKHTYPACRNVGAQCGRTSPKECDHLL